MFKLGLLLFFVLITHVVCHRLVSGNKINDAEQHLPTEIHDSRYDDTMEEVLNLADKQCEEAKDAIFMCPTESLRARCIWVNGKWKSFNIGECEPPKYCNTTVEGCVKRDTRIILECGTFGHFPDPQFCNIYHKCSEDLKSTQEKCPTGHVFDAYSRKCRTEPESCQIERAKYDTGVLAAYPNTRNMYYMCSERGMNGRDQIITMFSCPEGYEYVQFLERCNAYQPPGNMTENSIQPDQI